MTDNLEQDTFTLAVHKQKSGSLPPGSVWCVAVLDPSGQFIARKVQILASSSELALAKARQHYPGAQLYVLGQALSRQVSSGA